MTFFLEFSLENSKVMVNLNCHLDEESGKGTPLDRPVKAFPEGFH